MARITAINAWMKDYAAVNGHVYLDYFSAMTDAKGLLLRLGRLRHGRWSPGRGLGAGESRDERKRDGEHTSSHDHPPYFTTISSTNTQDVPPADGCQSGSVWVPSMWNLMNRTNGIAQLNVNVRVTPSAR